MADHDADVRHARLQPRCRALRVTRVLLDVPHEVAGHCGSGSLRDLLAWAGLSYGRKPLSEPLAFALAGGLAFQYLRREDDTPPIYLVGRTGEMELEGCRRLGIDVAVRRTDDPGEGWRFVTDELDAGRPVMINADILELPYLRVQLSNTRHSLLVVGYDDDEGVAYLVDNDRADLQEVALPALDRARSTAGFPDPPRYATYPMRFPDRLPALLDVARSACADAVRHLDLGRGLFPEGTLDGVVVDATGTAGVRTFADDLAGWGEVLGADELATSLRALRVFIEKAGTGTGMFRRLQADGLREAGERTGDEALLAAAGAWRLAADAWSALASATGDGVAAAAAAADELPGLEARALEATRVAAEGRTADGG
ncbi:MAG: BtrH N-terminal domain-containing protein [Actinobacteria bacterium]|nr:BtrH N-terminal domain-containing protein [Actinomycetota bacterium]